MISERNVIRMRVPFPNIDSGLAAQPHMYICMKNGTQKEFLKCQSFKPMHLVRKRLPFNCIIEGPDIKRNPFNGKTTIDCDKSFGVEKVIVDKSLITTKREDVCEDLFNELKSKIIHKDFSREHIDITSLLSLNTKMRRSV